MNTLIFNVESAPIDRQFFYNLKGHGNVNVLTLGTGSYIGRTEISFFEENFTPPHVLIGRFCSLADEIYFSIGGNHHYKKVSSFPFDVTRMIEKIFIANNIEAQILPYHRPNRYQIIIGHDVWIGRGATVMGGVKIGNGAVIGAKAVVAKDIPPYAIAVGNPARVVKYRFDEETIKNFLAVKWWNWDLKKLGENLPLIMDVEKFLETHYSPELENFPEDDFSRYLNNFGGGCVYQFIADFRAARPLWIKVVHEFCQSNFEKNFLVIYLGKGATETDLKNLAVEINRFGNGAGKNILVVNLREKIFSSAALRKGTHFITTREMMTLEALDYLWGTNVKIISALDDGIFKDA